MEAGLTMRSEAKPNAEFVILRRRRRIFQTLSHEGSFALLRMTVRPARPAPEGHKQWSEATRPKGPRGPCRVSQAGGCPRPAPEGHKQ